LALSVHSGAGPNPFDESSFLVFNTDGTGRRLLYRGLNQNVNPAWSPDGSRIAFESNAGDWHVLTIAAAGGAATTLGDGRLPQWSPAGDRISFISQRARVVGGPYSYRFDLYVMDADGSGVQKLADDVHPNLPPQWSPDGGQLSYSAGRDCLRWGIYVQASIGGREVQRTNRCHLDGTRGRDRLVGTEYVDIIRGLGGADTILGRGGPDTIDGGTGDDRILAGRQPDVVTGGPGNDHIVTGQGNDHVTGGPGVDTISAGLGQDIINARDGVRDVIDCGGGPELDSAVVDRRDVVRNCERVSY
jgi:Ca2+-binding RTX toxin-like protein